MYIVSRRHELRNALMKVPVWIWKLMASSQVLTSVNEVKKRTRKGWRSLGGGGGGANAGSSYCLFACSL